MSDDVADLEEFKFRKEAAPYETRTNQIHALAERIGAMLPREWDAREGALVLAHAWLNAIDIPASGRLDAAIRLTSLMMLLVPDETAPRGQ